MAEALRISDLGLRLVIAVGAGFGSGLWLDRKLATTAWGHALGGFPLLAVIGSVVGFGAGMVALVTGLTRGERSAPPSSQPGPPDADRDSNDETDGTPKR